MESEPADRITTLERLRIERGLSRLEVERSAPITRKTLASLENVRPVTPRARTLYRLARLYDVRPDWLLTEYRRDRRKRLAA